jgi:hypothetical protein
LVNLIETKRRQLFRCLRRTFARTANANHGPRAVEFSCAAPQFAQRQQPRPGDAPASEFSVLPHVHKLQALGLGEECSQFRRSEILIEFGGDTG